MGEPPKPPVAPSANFSNTAFPNTDSTHTLPVEKSIQLRPDLIILDISMPGIGGVEAARQIRVFLPEVPILFFTTHNSPQLLALSKLVGAQGFITKNETAVTLLKAVDALRNGKTFFQLLISMAYLAR